MQPYEHHGAVRHFFVDAQPQHVAHIPSHTADKIAQSYLGDNSNSATIIGFD